MTSLTDAYDRRTGEVSRHRVYVGTGLFAAGALMVVAGIVAGTTEALLPADPSTAALMATREFAATLVGLGVPAVLVGVVTVLPASRRTRVAAAGGALVAVVGVALFRSVYPGQWYKPGTNVPTDAVLVLVAVYAVGLMATLWCLFTAVATFKRRNDPGGTVTLTIEENGRTRTVEVPREELQESGGSLPDFGAGGVGVFGTSVEDVQADQPGTPGNHEAGGGSGGDERSASAGGAPTSDGGTAASDVTSPVDDGEAGAGRGPDRYCGNCAHFDYVRTGNGIRPYCGLREELMDDVEACEEWTPNHD